MCTRWYARVADGAVDEQTGLGSVGDGGGHGGVVGQTGVIPNEAGQQLLFGLVAYVLRAVVIHVADLCVL